VSAVELGPGFGTGVAVARGPVREDVAAALAFWCDLVRDDTSEPG